MKLAEISKTISHALRHEPWIYELEPDSAGWVPIDSLISALNYLPNKELEINLTILLNIINSSDKPRFEIRGNKIRASYGHTIPVSLEYKSSIPPDILFHGTSMSFLPGIINNGLIPMNRNYVHLSTNQEMAYDVAKRKGKETIILTIKALEAYKTGQEFYIGNKFVWLSKAIGPKFISYKI